MVAEGVDGGPAGGRVAVMRADGAGRRGSAIGYFVTVRVALVL